MWDTPRLSTRIHTGCETHHGYQHAYTQSVRHTTVINTHTHRVWDTPRLSTRIHTECGTHHGYQHAYTQSVRHTTVINTHTRRVWDTPRLSTRIHAECEAHHGYQHAYTQSVRHTTVINTNTRRVWDTPRLSTRIHAEWQTHRPPHIISISHSTIYTIHVNHNSEITDQTILTTPIIAIIILKYQAHPPSPLPLIELCLFLYI